MSWSISLAPTPRADVAAVMDEHRVSNSGHCPDAVVDMIAAEVEGLEPQWDKVSISTYGHVGSGSPRTASFSIVGTT